MGAESSRPMAPVAKVGAFLRRLDVPFALRFLLATLLAWLAAFSLQLDKPYWAIMTVTIVSYPSQGTLIAKFIARLFGTVVGILMVTWLAGISLNEPWLMSVYLALWLALCTYIAGCYSGMVTYACALCGYTSAIVGFGISISPSPYSIFFTSQARLSEIVVGLTSALLVTFLLPSQLDNRLFQQAAKHNRQTMRDLFISCLRASAPDPAPYRRWYSLVIGLMNAKVLAVNDSLAPAVDKTGNRWYSRFADRQLRLSSGLISLNAMRLRVLHDAGADVRAAGSYLDNLAAWLGGEPFPPPAAPPPPPAELTAHRAGEHFCRALDYCLEELRANPADPGEERPEHNLFPSAVFRDHHEMRRNAARTFCSVMLGVFFWLDTNWDMGYVLTVLIGIACALGAHFPMVNKLALVVLAAALLAVPVAYVLMFYFFISTAELLPAMLVMSPVLLFAGVGKSLSPVAFIFFHVFMLAIIFLINFANPIDYDFSRYANTAVAAVFSVLIVVLVFYAIPQSADGIKLDRMYRAVTGRFTRGMAQEPRHASFESYVYSALFLARIMPGSPAKQRLVRLCQTTLAISKIRYRAWRQAAISLFFPAAFIDALLEGRYADCLELTARNMADGDEESWGYWWEIQALLLYLHEDAALEKHDSPAVAG